LGVAPDEIRDLLAGFIDEPVPLPSKFVIAARRVAEELRK